MTAREFDSYFTFERDDSGAPKIDLLEPMTPETAGLAAGGYEAFRKHYHLNGITTEETIRTLWNQLQQG